MSAAGKKSPSEYDWKEDLARFFHMLNHIFPFWLIALVAIGAMLLLPPLARLKHSRARTVVLYAAQDQVYAEPILKAFEAETGIRVRVVYDSEAVKTVGLANRLLAERRRPQCDVFWGNEELRTRQLAAQGVFRESNGWAAFGYRSRRIAVSGHATNLPAPNSLLELTNALYRGRLALAYPLFGTTATHFLALREHWGESNWLAWCRGLAANRPFIVDGNSVAAKFVARGETALALTDSDDIAAEVREGAKLRALPMNGETLLIPNTVAVVRECPHPKAAQRLLEFLQRRSVAEKLVAAQALEGVSTGEVAVATLRPDWDALLRDIHAATDTLQTIFLR
jgi:iron(III) transport system substrate-binding protein